MTYLRPPYCLLKKIVGLTIAFAFQGRAEEGVSKIMYKVINTFYVRMRSDRL